EAIKWYRRAAEQGFARAQNNLGVRYANGDGLDQNLDEAFRWFKLAADQGNAEAIASLAGLYAGAHHLSPNYSEAYFWALIAHYKAETNVDDFSEELLKELRARLSAEDAAFVEKQAQEWIQKHSFRPGALGLPDEVEMGQILAAQPETKMRTPKSAAERIVGPQ